jgi:hypothetical protein
MSGRAQWRGYAARWANQGLSSNVPPTCRFAATIGCVIFAFLPAACGKAPADSVAAKAPAAAGSAPVLLLAPEDLRTVSAGDGGGGPVITGSVLPEKRADLRAEVGGIVMQVL